MMTNNDRKGNNSYDNKISGATTTSLQDYSLQVYGLGPLLKCIWKIQLPDIWPHLIF